MEKNYKLPPITWLKVTDFIHCWLQSELGGALRVMDQKVVSIQHLDGARDVLMMETDEDMLGIKKVDRSMSATLKNCIETGLSLDPSMIEATYGVTREMLKLFVPIECPKMCLTKGGVMRPWVPTVNFGRQQAAALQQLLRDEFWKAVEAYSREYAMKQGGNHYAQVKMIEAFCRETKTPDLHVEALRREWQRRCKRIKNLEFRI